MTGTASESLESLANDSEIVKIAKSGLQWWDAHISRPLCPFEDYLSVI